MAIDKFGKSKVDTGEGIVIGGGVDKGGANSEKGGCVGPNIF
jgi:hypothetical protein